MSDTRPLYQITVHVETIVEQYGGEAYAHRITSDDRAEWKTDRHRNIIIESASPDPAEGHTPDEVLAAARWAAGVLARVTLLVMDRLRDSALRDQHGCLSNEERFSSDWCGAWSGEFVSYPEWGLPDGWPPSVRVKVPTGQANEWRGIFREELAKVLDHDQRPAELPKPEPTEHAGVMLTQNTHPSQEERTR